MSKKDEIIGVLRNLELDRKAVTLMKEDVARIAEDQKREGLPALQREALEKERLELLSSMVATENHIRRVERLLALLAPEEREVLVKTLICPYPEAVFDLASDFKCETTRIYRLRARAINKLVRLRFGAGE